MTDSTIADIVRRIASLENRLERSVIHDSGIGNARLLGGNRADGPGSAFLTTSASYVDYGGTDYTRKTFTKLQDAAQTNLMVVFTVAGYNNTGTGSNGIYEIGVQFGSTDSGSWRFTINPNAVYAWVTGYTTRTTLDAGAIGIELRVRRSAGATTFGFDSNGSYGFWVFEVPISVSL